MARCPHQKQCYQSFALGSGSVESLEGTIYGVRAACSNSQLLGPKDLPGCDPWAEYRYKQAIKSGQLKVTNPMFSISGMPPGPCRDFYRHFHHGSYDMNSLLPDSVTEALLRKQREKDLAQSNIQSVLAPGHHTSPAMFTVPY